MQIFFFRAACLLGGLGIVLGAFGAHGLQKLDLSERMLQNWETAVRYQMYHALALLAISLAAPLWQPAGGLAAWAGWAWLGGVAVFSGSLYLMALTGITRLGMITPIGGVLLIGGWVLLLCRAGALK